MNADLWMIVLVPLAAGRAAYSVAHEEIFRPVREYVFRYSAPMTATDIEGRPWRMIDWYKSTEHERKNLGAKKIEYDFDPQTLRNPGFFGQLFECPYCLSFWFTMIMVVIGYWYPHIVLFLALWALSSLFVRLMP